MDERDVERVRSALRAVSEADEHLSASPAVASRLLAEVESMGRARRRRTRATVAGALGVAALVAALVLRNAAPVAEQPADASAATAPAADPVRDEMATQYFPLTYANVPARSMRVVRLEVPRTALAAFGAESFAPAASAAATITADVVVGDDGLARAVRFVHVVDPLQPEEQRP